MKKSAISLAIAAALAFLPLHASAQNAAAQWGAISISMEGGVWPVQNSPSAQTAGESALASCMNHSQVPKMCVVGMGTAWLAAGRCLHRTSSGTVITRIGVNGGPNEIAAMQNVIIFLIKYGDVQRSDCDIIGAFNAASGAAAPSKPAGESF